jgi:hypothetical protein
MGCGVVEICRMCGRGQLEVEEGKDRHWDFEFALNLAYIKTSKASLPILTSLLSLTDHAISSAETRLTQQKPYIQL